MVKKKLTKVEKSERFYQAYKFKHCMGIANEAFMEELQDKLLDFAYNAEGDESFIVYLHSLGIHKVTFGGWCAKYPNLKATYEQAKAVMAGRRLSAGLRRKLDASLCKAYLYLLDSDFKEEKDKEESRTKFIVLEQYSDKQEPKLSVTTNYDEKEEDGSEERREDTTRQGI